MVWIERGRVQGGSIVFPRPLELAEGTEVEVRIKPLVDREQGENDTEAVAFEALPFFGMWADREDMQDTTAWVRQAREQWQQRALRQD